MLLILEATDRKTYLPIEAGPACNATAIAKGTEPGRVGTDLRRAPTVTDVANIIEITIDLVAIAARKT